MVGLKDLVAAEASAGEAQGRLTERVVTALTDAGLLAMWDPGNSAAQSWRRWRVFVWSRR